MLLQDLNIERAPLPGITTKIEFYTSGVFPCRSFVANWENVQHFSTGGCIDPQSYQLVMYESTNIVEIHVRNRSVCSWNGGNGLIGIQNDNGTQALAAPGRNTGNWTAREEGWRFSPAGAQVGVTYAWYLADAAGQPTGPVLGTSQTLNVSPTVTTNYVVVATIQTCNPTEPLKVKDVTTVKVNEPAGEKPLDIFHCDTDTNPLQFNIGSNTNVILDGLVHSDFEVFYYASELDADNDTPLSYTANETSLIFNMPATPRTREIWYVVNDIASDCREKGSFKIGLLDCKIDLIACDTDNDDTEVLDLNDYIALIDTSNTGDNLTLA
ncbi:MAG: hypothetical protein EOO89_32165, partial [Pedobacter sp.]